MPEGARAFRLALVAALLCGMLSLSLEIVWVRIYSFITGGSSSSFGVVLGAYLLGIAFGSLLSRRYCKGPGDARQSTVGDPRPLRLVAALGLAASLLAFVLVPAIGYVVSRTSFVVSLPLVVVAAMLLGAQLPLISHFGIPADDDAGARLSYLYLANIVGSTAGSLGTGFLLLDRLPLGRVALVLALAGVLLSLLLVLASRPSRGSLLRWGAALGAVVALLFTMTPLYAQIYEPLLLKREFHTGRPSTRRIARLIENKSGVITVLGDEQVYGSGAFDGVFNLSPIRDRNAIVRAYALSALHPAPRQVLMIGLSSGSWAQVVAHHPQLERLTVIEINPGYLELVRGHREVSSVLEHPRVRVIIDDGRRWLLAHRDTRFDMIVMNTTWHWRGYSTTLLSREFLERARRHLRPGGVLFFNTTYSPHAMRTACSAFAHGVRVQNMMAVGEAPVRFDVERMIGVVSRYRIDGRWVFESPAQAGHYAAFLRGRFGWVLDGPDIGFLRHLQSCSAVLRQTAGLPIITDDNMVTEFGRAWWSEAAVLNL